MPICLTSLPQTNGYQSLGERSWPLGGLISSCGCIELCPHHLSAVIGASILLEVCCVHSDGAPHSGEAPAQRDTYHNTACFHSQAGKKKRKREAGRQLCTLSCTEHRRQLPNAVGTASSLAPPFLDTSIILTSSYM